MQLSSLLQLQVHLLFGLKGIHVSCLFYLYNNPEGLTAAQLSGLCCEDKAAVSRIVSQLRQRGFIEPGGKKSYRELLKLTAAGREIARQMEPVMTQWVCAGGEGLTEQEREHFYRSLTVIAANLHNKLDD